MHYVQCPTAGQWLQPHLLPETQHSVVEATQTALYKQPLACGTLKHQAKPQWSEKEAEPPPPDRPTLSSNDNDLLSDKKGHEQHGQSVSNANTNRHADKEPYAQTPAGSCDGSQSQSTSPATQKCQLATEPTYTAIAPRCAGFLLGWCLSCWWHKPRTRCSIRYNCLGSAKNRHGRLHSPVIPNTAMRVAANKLGAGQPDEAGSARFHRSKSHKGCSRGQDPGASHTNKQTQHSPKRHDAYHVPCS